MARTRAIWLEYELAKSKERTLALLLLLLSACGGVEGPLPDGLYRRATTRDALASPGCAPQRTTVEESIRVAGGLGSDCEASVCEALPDGRYAIKGACLDGRTLEGYVTPTEDGFAVWANATDLRGCSSRMVQIYTPLGVPR